MKAKIIPLRQACCAILLFATWELLCSYRSFGWWSKDSLGFSFVGWKTYTLNCKRTERNGVDSMTFSSAWTKAAFLLKIRSYQQRRQSGKYYLGRWRWLAVEDHSEGGVHSLNLSDSPRCSLSVFQAEITTISWIVTMPIAIINYYHLVRWTLKWGKFDKW